MTNFSDKLARIEQLAQGSRWQRLLHAPGRYLFALGFRQFVYARNRRARPTDVMTFFGLPMRVLLPAGTDLYLLGAKTHESETRLARLLMHELRPGDVFIDIGGHFGYFSLLASQLVGASGKVLTFEASHSTFAVLAHNVQAQPNITACNEAMSDRPEAISFYEFPVLNNECNSMDVEQFRHEKWFADYPPQKIEVPATTLDAVVQRFGVVPAIIKIDVEGAELKVIKGGLDTLRRLRPLVVMEYLAPTRHNDAHRQAAALLHELGYASFVPGHDGQPEPCPDPNAYLAQHGEDSDNILFRKL